MQLIRQYSLKNNVLGLLILIVGNMIAIPTAFASFDPFPEYEAIKSNVLFWEKVYSQYSSKQGIIHDSYRVNIIYDVINLVPNNHHNARRINKQRVKNVKKKYKEILKNLATGKSPGTPEEIRVASLFSPLNGKTDFLKSSKRIRCQVGQRDRFQEGLKRSGAYIEEIKQIFLSFGLPVDLSYLPHVESSFNLKAYSKFGAAGIWQFTRSTGRQFMRVNYSVDERRDPILSSIAAAKLLKKNYQKLGNWPMAITAYNYGATGMQKAKNEKGDYESIFKHYRKGYFKFASRNFYSEFLAAREVAENYQTYFKNITLDSPQKRRKVIMPGYASFSEVADYLKIDPNIIRKFNPALRKPVFLEQKYIPKGYCLLLPEDTNNPLMSEVKLPSRLLKKRQKHSSFYRVQKGDTAGKIARKHGVRLNDLILANNLNKRAVIYVNQNLRIPKKGEKLKGVVKSKPAKVVKKAKHPVPQNKIIKLPEKPQEETKTIVLKESNEKKEIKNKELINPSIVTGNMGVISSGKETGREIGYIQVEVEETIGHYADWLKVTASDIRRLNGFRFGRMIRLHEKIKIPFDKISKVQFEEKRFEHHKEIEEDFFASYRIDGFQTYMVKKGDNIWTLCYEKFDLPIWLVRNCNIKLDFTNLLASQKLQVPQVAAIQ